MRFVSALLPLRDSGDRRTHGEDGATGVANPAMRDAGSRMSAAIVVALSLAAAPASPCSWNHPGANPYRGDPAVALADFRLPADTTRQLREMMRTHRYTDVATITRDIIEGDAKYDALREMHSGHGVVCHGRVDRSGWPAGHVERGLVYCVGDACVIVPTICNNVALVSRTPRTTAASASSTHDVRNDSSPSGGAGAAVLPGGTWETLAANRVEDELSTVDVALCPALGKGGAGCLPMPSELPSVDVHLGVGLPPLPPLVVVVGTHRTPPPLSCVPEPPSAAMALAAMALLSLARMRRAARQ